MKSKNFTNFFLPLLYYVLFSTIYFIFIYSSDYLAFSLTKYLFSVFVLLVFPIILLFKAIIDKKNFNLHLKIFSLSSLIIGGVIGTVWSYQWADALGSGSFNDFIETAVYLVPFFAIIFIISAIAIDFTWHQIDKYRERKQSKMKN